MVGNETAPGDRAPPEFSAPLVSVADAVQSIVGCKWSLAVIGALKSGANRPSEIERACPGMSNKVMYERLRKLERFGFVDRTVENAVPPHVEYHLNDSGRRFLRILDVIDEVQAEIDAQ